MPNLAEGSCPGPRGGGPGASSRGASAYLATREDREARAEHPDGGFWAAGARTEVPERFVYPDERLCLGRHTIVEPARTRTIWNWFQAYDPAARPAVLGAAGFTIEALQGDVAGRPYDPASTGFAVVACTR